MTGVVVTAGGECVLVHVMVARRHVPISDTRKNRILSLFSAPNWKRCILK